MGGAGLARPVTDTLLKAINSTQLRQIRTMLGGGRPPEKAWVDWNQRTLRRARVLLHQAGEPRWSTFLLGQMWDMARSREGGADMLRWKNLAWWKQQQAIPRTMGGARHGQRFNANADPDRCSGGAGVDADSL